MTTEDDFQAQLDTNPEDHYTRLVFADWLEERDDPRSEGYRVMGQFRLSPQYQGNKSIHNFGCWYWRDTETGRSYKGHLRTCWYNAIVDHNKHKGFYIVFDTRRKADDAAALAYSTLSPARKKLVAS